jgi:hydroxymethylbilane synthase
MELPAGSAVGTSSLRRASQILRARPDLRIEHIRGNVDSRLRKLRAEGGPYDAIVLAKAGLDRLGLQDQVTECIAFDHMLPAPGQGALAVQCRSDDAELLEMLGRFHDPLTAAEVCAERAFLAALEAGCNTPVGALAKIERRGDKQVLVFRGRCLSPDGTKALEVAGEASVERAADLGNEMAASIRAQGFDSLAHS